MITDWVEKYTHTQHDSLLILKTVVSTNGFNVKYECSRLAAICRHDQCKRSDYNQVILVHTNVVHTPGTCDDSLFKIG